MVNGNTFGSPGVCSFLVKFGYHFMIKANETPWIETKSQQNKHTLGIKMHLPVQWSAMVWYGMSSLGKDQGWEYWGRLHVPHVLPLHSRGDDNLHQTLLQVSSPVLSWGRNLPSDTECGSVRASTGDRGLSACRCQGRSGCEQYGTKGTYL